MAEIFSVFGVQTAHEREQLVITYPTGKVEVINGPNVQWVAPGATVERRPAIVLKRKQYCIVENSEITAARVVKGPQVLFLGAFESAGSVLPAISLKENQYVRLRNNRTGQDRVEVGPSDGIFPPPHETVFDNAPQQIIQLADGEHVEILEAVTNSVRVARGPTLVFLSTTESLVDQSLLVEAEEQALAEALALSKQANANVEHMPYAKKESDAQENAPANRRARADASPQSTSPRTAVHSFLSHLLGKKTGGKDEKPELSKWGEAPKKELETTGNQLQSLGRTVRFRARAGGPTFAEVHAELLLDLETRLKLQPRYVGGRGDCLFCCFLHYDGKVVDKGSIKGMRNEIANAIRQVVLEDPYMGVIFASNAGSDRRKGEGVTVEQYIAGIRNKAWGDTVCITQFCRLRRIKARLHTIMNDERMEETDFSDGGRQAKTLEIIHHPDPEDGEMYHYEVLVPKVAGKEESGLTLKQWRREVEAVAAQGKGRGKNRAGLA